MSYANKLRVRSRRHADLFIELNTSIKDFRRAAEVNGNPLDYESLGHRIVNIAYENLAKEARRNIEPFNPRWSTVYKLREEIAGKLNEHFTKLQGQTNQSTEGVARPNL
jgi:hypothetical protein